MIQCPIWGLGLSLALALPKFAQTADLAGRDGGTTNLPHKCDSGAFPLRGRRGWGENVGNRKPGTAGAESIVSERGF